MDQENLNISRFIDSENVKKLSALYTEFTGNMIALSEAPKGKDSELYLSSDCLKLLLQTMYVDLGPEVLKEAYELEKKLRKTKLGYRDKDFLISTIVDIRRLASKILEVRNHIAQGQYKEPSQTSIMMWQLDQFISMDFGTSCVISDTLVTPLLKAQPDEPESA